MTERDIAQAREHGNDERLLARRDFLQRTASMAGMAGAIGVLPTTKLLNTVNQVLAPAQPGPRNTPLKHVVILMMENRSFDHYLGWLPPELAQASQHESYADPGGNPVSTIHFRDLPGEADYQGCGHPDPGHGWNSGRAQLQNGFMANGSGNDIFALTYFNQNELGFIHAAAQEYTVYDNYFCSALTSTWPNRYYKWSATAGGRQGNSPPAETLGNQWDTIFDVALRKTGNTANLPLPGSLNVGYYASDLPFAAVWGARAVPWVRPAVQYFADCALGTLPNITIIDPPFRDGGGFDGNSADEHPHGDVRLGQAFMADVARAFVESPCYRDGALFIIYDEWGGFFDHVKPPTVPDDRATPGNLATDWGQLGFRTPTVCISPWTRRKSADPAFRVNHGQFAHESILRLAANQWGLGDLNLRHKTANDIGTSFDWANPDYEPPDLPNPTHIVSKPCALGGGDLLTLDSVDAHSDDLAGLDDLAERFGFKIYDSTPENLFREPNSVTSSYVAPGA